MSELFGLLPILGLVIVIIGPLFWSLHVATKPVRADSDGWITLRSTIADHIFGFLAIILSVGLFSFGCFAVLGGVLGAEAGDQILIVAAFVLSGIFAWQFVMGYASTKKFNAERVTYSALFRKIDVFWNGVEKIKMGMNGPKTVTVEGSFNISNLHLGFYQLLDTARKNGVSIQENPYLKPYDAHWPYKKKQK